MSLLVLLLSQHSYQFTRKSYFGWADSRLSVHLQSGFPLNLPCTPQEIFLHEAATELSGSQFVLEYVNPDLRLGVLCEGSWW